MADMGLPALALRTDYINDSGIERFRQGQQDAVAENERKLLKQVGGIASTGNYLDASRAAMKGGNVKLGTDIANWDMERKSKAYEFLLNGVQRADTEEKYQTLVDMVTRTFGPEMVRGYETFDKRPNAMTTLQEATQALERRKAESQIALQESTARLHDAQAVAARQKTPDVAETLRALDNFRRTGSSSGAPSGSVGAGQSGGAVPQQGGSSASISPTPSVSQQAPPGETDDLGMISRLPRETQAAIALAVQKGDLTAAGKILTDASDDEDKLRKEHTGLIKNFQEAQSGIQQLETAYKTDNSIGDIAMVYALMKALDPGSVVRETEYGFVVNSQSIPQALVQRINQFWDGKRLAKGIRDEMVSHGRNAMETRLQEYERLTNQIQGIARYRGLSPSRSTLDARMDNRDAAIPRLGQFGSGAGAVAESARSMAQPQQRASQPPPANAAQILEEARAKIREGVDRNKIIERLQSLNIDPRGL